MRDIYKFFVYLFIWRKGIREKGGIYVLKKGEVGREVVKISWGGMLKVVVGGGVGGEF